MKAIDYIAQQLGHDDSYTYGARFKNQPKVTVTLRLPLELVAWLDALKDEGLGTSRSDVAVPLLDSGIESVLSTGFGQELEAKVEAMMDAYNLRIEEEGEQ